MGVPPEWEFLSDAAASLMPTPCRFDGTALATCVSRLVLTLDLNSSNNFIQRARFRERERGANRHDRDEFR